MSFVRFLCDYHQDPRSNDIAKGTRTADQCKEASLRWSRHASLYEHPSCQHSRICSNPAMKHRLLYTYPFCVLTERQAPVPSWVHNQVQDALTMGISPQLVNKVAMLHLQHLLEPAKASTVAAKTRSTASSVPPCTNRNIRTGTSPSPRHAPRCLLPCTNRYFIMTPCCLLLHPARRSSSPSLRHAPRCLPLHPARTGTSRQDTLQSVFCSTLHEQGLPSSVGCHTITKRQKVEPFNVMLGTGICTCCLVGVRAKTLLQLG